MLGIYSTSVLLFYGWVLGLYITPQISGYPVKMFSLYSPKMLFKASYKAVRHITAATPNNTDNSGNIINPRKEVEDHEIDIDDIDLDEETILEKSISASVKQLIDDGPSEPTPR